MDDKQKIRKEILKKTKAYKEELRLRKSLLIKNKLFKTKEFKEAENILFYLAFKGEVETRKMIEDSLKIGKTVLVPVCDMKRKTIVPSKISNLFKEELCIGSYGIERPRKIRSFSAKDIDLVIVPAVAFDKYNNRLGRGKGYYDRFLKKLSSRVKKIGLAFKFQIVDRLPVNLLDQPVDRVITA